jgi:hypothetical protein
MADITLASINIDATGSSGHLDMEVTSQELAFLQRLQERWNEVNGDCSQPMISVEPSE